MRRLLVAVIAIAVAVPLFASDPGPSKRQRELIVELLELTSGASTLQAALDVMLAQSEKQFIAQAEAEGYAPKDLDERKELYALLHEELAGIDLSAALTEPAIRIYAKHYTERELADLVTFYRTPTGRKSIAVLPEILRESAEASSQNIGPLLNDALIRAEHAQDRKRRPWKPTMNEMHDFARAISAYVGDQSDDRYPSGDYASLRALLEPAYLATLPATDAWGTPYAYAAFNDGEHFRLVSAGADLKFERDSLKVAGGGDRRPGVVYRDQVEADIILEDGVFVQLPAAVKGK